MRLFTAIEVPETVRDALAAAQTRLKQRIDGPVSWVNPKNLHVTLKFFGEVADDEVMKLCEPLESVAFSRLTIRVSQLGTLPPHGRAKVLTADLAGEVDALAKLFESIERVCEPLGFARENRRFCPHITLARLRSPRRIAGEIGEVTLKPMPAFEVREFVLMNSRLSSKGAEYEVVARITSKS